MSWKIKDEKVEKAIKALFIDDKSYQEAIDCGCEYAKYKGDNWIEVLGGKQAEHQKYCRQYLCRDFA